MKRTAAIALCATLAACGPSRPIEPQPTDAVAIIMACDQDDTLLRMECMLEDRPRMTSNGERFRQRVRQIYVATVGGRQSTAEAEVELSSMEMRLLGARIAALPPTPTYTPAPLHPNWLGTGVGTPRIVCVPGAGSISCY